MPLGYNRVLGLARQSEDMRPHRVAIAHWPTIIDDPRTRSLEALAGHVAAAGYEGFEIGVAGVERYFPDESPVVVARKARRILERENMANFGATLHLTDDGLRELNWLDEPIEQMRVELEFGSEFVSFQLAIHPDYANTGGLYREDEGYLAWCADRVARLRDAAWDLGLNFYLELHVDRITEDPSACCRIHEMVTCELNGDMSHFLARGMLRGRYMKRIMKYIGHTHIRMARLYGDLSAEVEDPQADWEAEGVTWQLFDFMKPALEGGLSSRTISGETGPMHLVTDTLTQDAALVPLYRAMARYADASAQGIAMKVDSPADLKPWG